MKASKMTNAKLAKELIETVGLDGPFCQCDRCMTVLEAAARLRRPTPVDDDLLKMARDIDKLRAKLKVAEDALRLCASDRYCNHQCACERALAAIREEGGNDAH